MQELTPTSLANVFAEIEMAANKLIVVVFKNEVSMMDFFNAIADKINDGELSGIFNEKTNNTINLMLLDEFLEYRGQPPDYILYEHRVGEEMSWPVGNTTMSQVWMTESTDDDIDALDAFLNEFNRRK